jgi:chromosomal replication initiator protein
LSQYIGDQQNLLVRSAFESLLEHPPRYSPVTLFGRSGTGKTMLARGVAGIFRHEKRGSRIICTTGADFARDYALAVQTDSVDDFRQKVRRATLLVIDDLDEMGDKLTAQEELTRSLDTLLQRERSVLVTLHQAPLETANLTPPLASRLSAGLTVPLEPPGDAARRRILKQLAAVRGASLPDAAIDLIVSGVPGASVKPVTVPQLLSVLNQLEQLPDEPEGEIDEYRVRRYFTACEPSAIPQLRSITKHVCKYFKVRSGDLRGPARQQRIVRARGVAMLLARQLTDKSLEQVGRHYGNRDHTTVLHACRKTESLIQADPSIRQAVEELTRQLCGS